MAKYRVARFWFDVDADSPDEAAQIANELPPSTGWIAPDPSTKYEPASDPLLEEARWLLEEWATSGNDPVGGLAQRSRETAIRLRDRLRQD